MEQPDSIFVYDGLEYSEDRASVSFSYTLNYGGETFTFTEGYQFEAPLADCMETEQLLRALHLAAGISYYKIFMSPVLTHPYKMDEAEAGFWNQVFRGGLGEFLYLNKLDPSGLAKFSAQDGETPNNPRHVELSEGALLGIGGGKDSILAGEVLKAAGVPVEGFVMATGEVAGQSQAVADVMGVAMHKVERRLDPLLIEVQEKPGAHKGHVPISLIFALVGSLLAINQKQKYLVVANEASASIPRVSWAGEEVNHQWSKSFEFEKTLQAYLHEHVSPQLEYFSAIRPLSSVAVAKAFSKLPQYFEVFTSDNFVFRIDPAKRPHARWSLESPKSLSSFILLSPWLDPDTMLRIFGKNFLDATSLETLFFALVGAQGEPPLDCVGTVDELVVSLNLAYNQGKYHDASLVKLAVDKGIILENDWQASLEKMLLPLPDSAFPAALADRLHKELGA